MSKGKKLINKMKRRERNVLEASKLWKAQPKTDKRATVTQASPGVLKTMRKPQRKMDKSFGYNAVPGEAILECRFKAVELERFDFGGSYGLRLTLPGPVASPNEEEVEITTLAETSVSATFTLTAPAAAAASQGDYMLLTAPNGDVVALWLDIDADDTEPTGAGYVAADSKVKVAIIAGDTNVQVAAKLVTALNGIADLTVTDNEDGTVEVVYDEAGERPDPTVHNADDSGDGSLEVVVDNPGADSNLNSSYFLINSPTNYYYVWYDVDGNGVDPALAGKTGLPVAISAAASADDVASATALVLDNVADFTSSATDDVVHVITADEGEVPDASDGAVPTGFTFEVVSQGSGLEGPFNDFAGIQPGDTIQILDGDLAGRMLEVVSILSETHVRLDDVSTFTSEEDVHVRAMLSEVKKSYK